MRRAVICVAVVLTLSGCATKPDDPRASAEAMEPLTCANKAQCDAYWQRAQAWIAENSAWKIQTVSDAVIQTYGPAGARVDLAYSVTRVPRPDGSAQISMAANCDNFIRCYPTRTDAIVAFKRFVRESSYPVAR